MQKLYHETSISLTFNAYAKVCASQVISYNVEPQVAAAGFRFSKTRSCTLEEGIGMVSLCPFE